MKPIADFDMRVLSEFLAGRDDFVLLDTARATEVENHSLLFMDPLQWLICTGSGEVEDFLRKVSNFEQQGYFLAGWFSYEFGYLLESSLKHLLPSLAGPYAVIGVFGPPLVIDHRQGDFSALKDLEAKDSGLAESAYQIHDMRTSIDEQAYLAAIDQIKKYIVAGDTYQVNFTLKLLFSFHGSPAALYRTLRRNQAVSYGAWIRQGGRDIMSFSPELFFRTDGSRVTVRPMKGTMARGRTLPEDRTRQEALRSDLKNRSENVMIVDLLRNDLGRLLHNTGGGRVHPRSLFDVEVYDTLLQMTSTVEGVPAAGDLPGLYHILKALFPCGSVTGAPKIRTMEIIRELEKGPRGVYCGAIGYSGPDASVFNVPIRTVVLEEGKGEMGIGSGIIFDSDPEAEWQETLLKGNFLTRRQPDFQLIETLLWQPGSGYWLLDEHLERLADSAAYFLFGCDREQVTANLAEESRAFTGSMRIRLLLYRDGNISIAATELDTNGRPEIGPVVGSGPLPKVLFSKHRTDPQSIHLFHKTTQRRLYLDERQQALEKGFHEVLFMNKNGEVTEGSISNIFITAMGDDTLLTPPVNCGLLGGTFRRFLLDRGRAIEKVLTREDLWDADAIYAGNSVRGLVEVTVGEE